MTFDTMPWSLCLRAGIAAGLLAAGPVATQAEQPRLHLIGHHEIATGTRFEGVEFGGISALDRREDGRFYALSDDRGGERGVPRFYLLDLDYDETGFQGVTILETRQMKQPDGTPFPADRRGVDPEGLRTAPNGNLYWSSEGNFDVDPQALVQPFLREMTADGAYVRDVAVPGNFTYFDSETSGARGNKVFEALAVGPDGAVYLANEDAIVDDGPPTTLKAGSVVRVTRFDADSGTAEAQFAYALPPIPVDARPGAPSGPDYGLSDLLAMPDGSFLALERGFAWGVGSTIRLVHTAIVPETTDVLGIEGLADEDYTPMTRTRLLDIGPDYEGVLMDNMEGMAWGPNLPNGNPTLVLVSDNNFDADQRTLFLAFEVTRLPSQ